MHAGEIDRTADIGAIIVLLVAGLLRSRARAVLESIEEIVANVLVAGAMEVLAAALGRDNQLAGSGVAVLRGIVCSQHFHFACDVGRHAKVSLQADHAALIHEAFNRRRSIDNCFVAGYQAAIDARIECVATTAGRDTRHHDGHCH